jgi:gentisate 1,2-dioxygenase
MLPRQSKVIRMTGPTPQQLAQSGSLDALYRQLGPIRMGAGWAKPTPSLWPEPKKVFQPHAWSYAQAKGALDAAGRLINTELAERRNLILQNPAEGYATTRTIVAAYQMIMPGEKARSHRHTPNALRLVIDAEPGAYTVVNGERLAMMPGDVVLTPNWCWHGHGNDGRACAYWLDVLDVPLVQLLEPMFFEPHPDEFEAETAVPAASPMCFPWAQTKARLDAVASANGGVAEVALGEPGSPALDTMALSMIRLAAGQATAPHKLMANIVLGVVQGSGTTAVEGTALSWRRGDVIAVPSWREHVHRSDDGAVLFRVSDEPVMRKLGFLREGTPAH